VPLPMEEQGVLPHRGPVVGLIVYLVALVSMHGGTMILEDVG
jgi:hypothetical protein